MRPDQLLTLIEFIEEFIEAKVVSMEIPVAENYLALEKARIHLNEFIQELVEVK